MSTQELFRLSCNRCGHYFSTEGHLPIQSRTCQHSVCAVCIESVQKEKTSNGFSADMYIPCHDCHAANAFHLTNFREMANGLACGALFVLEKLQHRLQKDQEQEKSHPNTLNETFAKESSSISPSSPYEDNVTENSRNIQTEEAGSSRNTLGDKGSATTAPVTSSSKDSAMYSKHSKNSSTNGSPNGRVSVESSPNHHSYTQERPALVSPAPGERKLVFVKFGKASHLAYLLKVNGDMAKIRWESNKFEESIPIEMLEEIETHDSPSERPKRTRNVSNNQFNNSRDSSKGGLKSSKDRKSLQSPRKGRKRKMTRAN